MKFRCHGLTCIDFHQNRLWQKHQIMVNKTLYGFDSSIVDSLTDNIWVSSPCLSAYYLQTSVALWTNCELRRGTINQRARFTPNYSYSTSRAWLHVCTSTKQSCKIRRIHFQHPLSQCFMSRQFTTQKYWHALEYVICVFPGKGAGRFCNYLRWKIPRLFLITKLRHALQGILWSDCPSQAPS